MKPGGHNGCDHNNKDENISLTVNDVNIKYNIYMMLVKFSGNIYIIAEFQFIISVFMRNIYYKLFSSAKFY